MMYRVNVARSAAKEIEALPADVIARVFSRIEQLAVSQRPRGSKKLRGGGSLWRLRVGDYRIIYEIDDRGKVVDVVAVRHRSKAYE